MKVVKPVWEMAHVLEGVNLSKLFSNSWKLRTLYAIRRCRTAAMGGHIDRCDHPSCGKLHLSYNSCRNRHCPKCQGHQREQWIQQREAELLKVPYFHVVFTLPDHLNALSVEHPKEVYAILFKTAWQVIKGFGTNPKFLGATPGMVAVLHSWGQNLSLHPHLHCIVPGGGITGSGKWKPIQNKGKPGSRKVRYLFPVKAMGKVFRAKFLHALNRDGLLDEQLHQKLLQRPWVVYAKRPFFGPQQVVEYLGRYTHKIAISNHRIVAVGKGRVDFKVKNYKNGGQQEVVTLAQREFIRRFALHILPKGFVRIRHYGILSVTGKGKHLDTIRQQTGSVLLTTEREPLQLHRCPYCKKGRLQPIVTFDERGPPKHLLKLLSN